MASFTSVVGSTRAKWSDPNTWNNLLKYPDGPYDIAYWPATVGLSFEYNSIPDPLGYDTYATKMIETSANDFHAIRQVCSVVTGNVYELSFYVKYGTHRYIRLTHVGLYSSWFDLLLGTNTANDATVTGSITALGDGWYLVKSTWTANTTTSTNTVLGQTINGNGSADIIRVGDGSYTWVWGGQYKIVYPYTSVVSIPNSTFINWISGDNIQADNWTFTTPVTATGDFITAYRDLTYQSDVLAEPGLLHYWSFDGYSLSPQTSGSPSFYNYKGLFKGGKCGEHCWTSNGTDAYLKTLSDIDLSGTNKVAVECFMRFITYDLVNAKLLFELSDNANNYTTGFVAFNYGNGSLTPATPSPLLLALKGDVGYNVSSYANTNINNTMDDQLWHHCIFIFDKSQTILESSLYIDGILLTDDGGRLTGFPNQNNTNNFGSHPLYIAIRGNGLTNPSNIQIDEFAIYDMSNPSFNINNLIAHSTLGRAGVKFLSNTTANNVSITSSSISVTSGRVYKLGIKKKHSENASTITLTNMIQLQITNTTEFNTLQTPQAYSTVSDGWLYVRFTPTSSSITIKIQKDVSVTASALSDFVIEQITLQENYPDFPSVGWGQGTADTYTIPANSTVLYDIESINNIGAGSVSGKLQVMTDRNTRFWCNGLMTIQSTGEYSCGTSSSPLPKEYFHELLFFHITNGTQLFSLVNGGKFKLYGDPNYYGDQFVANMYSDVTGNAYNSISVSGDVSTKWKTCHILMHHKNALYSAYNTDSQRNPIGSTPVYDGTKTSWTPYVNIGSGTWKQDGYVINLSRNIRMGMGRASKIGFGTVNLNIGGGYGAPLPYITFSANLTPGNVVLDNIEFFGNYGSIILPFGIVNRTIFRDNSSSVSGTCQQTTFTDCVWHANNIGVAGFGQQTQFNNCYFTACANYGTNSGQEASFQNCKFFGAVQVTYTSPNFKFDGCDFFSNSFVTLYGNIGNIFNDCRFWYNTNVFSNGFSGLKLNNCYFGYDRIGSGIIKSNTYDFIVPFSDVYGKDCVFSNTNPLLSGFNVGTGSGKIYGDDTQRNKKIVFENQNKITDYNQTFRYFGIIRRNDNIVNDKKTSILAFPSSNCGIDTDTSLLCLEWFENNVPNEQQTRSVKILGYERLVGYGDMRTWSGIFPNEVPYNWTRHGTTDSNHYVTQSPLGQCRIYSSDNNTVGIYAGDGSLTLGLSYTLKFTIKNNVSGGIRVGDSISIATSPVYSTPGTYSRTWVAQHSQLNIASTGITDITIDDLTFYEEVYPSASELYFEAEYFKETGSEMQVNGNFENGTISPLGLYIESPANATASIQSNGNVSGNYHVKIDITNGGSSISNIQLFNGSSLMSIVKGLKYRLTFYAKGEVGKIIYVSILKHGAPFTDYSVGGGKYITIRSTEWTKYEYVFESNFTVSDARTEFMFGNSGSYILELDNISIKQIISDTIQSTSTLPNNYTWTDFPVTFTPAYTQTIKYRVYLKKYMHINQYFSIDTVLYRGELSPLNANWVDGECKLNEEYDNNNHKYLIRGNRKIYG